MGKGLALFAFGLAAWSGGGVVAYLLVNKDLKQHYEDIADHEIANAARFYARQHKEGEYSDPQELARDYLVEEETALKEAVEDLQYGEQSSSETDREQARQSINREIEDEPEDRNVFEQSESEHALMMEEYEADRKERHMLKRPVIIREEEYMENEPEYSQSTLTYFQGDDVLADETDDYIRDADAVVGDENLNRFGFLSNDNNTLYIQNDRLKAMYEVVHSSGEYKKEILGFIEHSDRPKVRRFRDRE